QPALAGRAGRGGVVRAVTTTLLFALVCAPALAAPLLFLPGRAGGLVRRVAPWAALPVLVMAVAGAGYPLIELDWLLVGARFELDAVGRVFLMVAAALWTAAGVYARGYVDAEGRPRFLFYFLLTMTGNLGLPLAADAVSFY